MDAVSADTSDLSVPALFMAAKEAERSRPVGQRRVGLYGADEVNPNVVSGRCKT